MAVESVDSSSQNRETRTAKDSYDERERELTVRHRQEMADLQRKHQKTVESIKGTYDQELGNLREKMRDAMSDREKGHMKEVQSIQEMNKRRYIQTKTDDDDKYQTTRNTLQGELDRAREKDQADQERLTKQYESDISKRNETETEMEARYRDANQTGLADQRKRLEEKAESEKNDLRKEVARTQKEKEKETSSLRKEKDSAINDLKARMEYQKESLDARYKAEVGRERKQYQENVNYLEDNFHQSLKENKDKFQTRAEQLADQYSNNFQNLKGSVNQRIEGELEPAKREVIALKDQNYNDRLQAKHQKELETTNLRSQFGKNIDELENRRQMEAQAAHMEKTRYLDEQQRRHNHDTQRQTQFFSTKLNEQKLADDKNIDQKIGSVERERDLTKMRADQINKKVFDNYADQTVKQEQFFDDLANVKQSAYDKRLAEQRTTLEKQKYDDINTLQNQLAKESIAHQEKLMDTISNYEKQMAGMRSDYEKRFKRQNELFHEQTEKQVKGMQMDREASESKLQARMSNLKETYEHEMDQLRKRQAAERQELASKKSGSTS